MQDASGAVLENIRNRRTLPWARMKQEPIAQEHLDQCLEAANWAPSHRHTEPWRFRIFRGEGRRKLASMLQDVYQAFSADKFNPAKHEKLEKRVLHVPAIIALIMDPSTNPVMPEYEELLAVGCAVQNFHLAAQALGIGVAWSTPGFVDHADLRAFFQLTEKQRCLGFLYLGYADPQDFPNSKRGSVALKTDYIDA